MVWASGRRRAPPAAPGSQQPPALTPAQHGGDRLHVCVEAAKQHQLRVRGKWEDTGSKLDGVQGAACQVAPSGYQGTHHTAKLAGPKPYQPLAYNDCDHRSNGQRNLLLGHGCREAGGWVKARQEVARCLLVSRRRPALPLPIPRPPPLACGDGHAQALRRQPLADDDAAEDEEGGGRGVEADNPIQDGAAVNGRGGKFRWVG